MSLDEERAWHEWRRGGVGGSDIAALLGLSNWGSPTSLFYEKTGAFDDDDEPDNDRQRIGKRMESVLAGEFQDRTGLFVVGEQTWCQHSQYPWARCTVDGFVADSPYGSIGPDGDLSLGTVEFKTDGRFGWPGGVPANIRAQAVWQMGVCELPHCWLVVMFAGFRIETFEIDWDDDSRADWAFMLDSARAFWVDHVMRRRPPPVDDSQATTEALTRVHRIDPDGILNADQDSIELVHRLQRAKLTTKAFQSDEDRLANELRAMLGDKTDLVDGWLIPKRGEPKPNVIASWRPQESRRVDTKALRQAEPAIAEKFTTVTASRVLRVASLEEPAQ